MEIHDHHIHLLHIFLWGFMVIAVSNLVALDFQAIKTSAQEKQTLHTVSSEAHDVQTPVSQVSLTPTITLNTQAPSPIIQTVINSQVKELFIPFGSGTNATDDWADVGALRVSVDSSQYKNIKSAIFEASVRIPTGNETAYVRLFNVTDKHPVWFSDVSLDGGTPQFLTSQPIILDPGVKTYQVQMKTSLKSQAVLDEARLHIIVN